MGATVEHAVPVAFKTYGNVLQTVELKMEANSPVPVSIGWQSPPAQPNVGKRQSPGSDPSVKPHGP